MVVSSYHVNNVLRGYRDQLRQSRMSKMSKNSEMSSPDGISILDRVKRRVIVNKIASDIIAKITNLGLQDDAEEKMSKNLEDQYGPQFDITRKSPNDLLFKIIDENGETLNSLSVENSEFFRYKLKEVDKETVEKSQKSDSEKYQMKIENRFLSDEIVKQLPIPASDSKETVEKEKLPQEQTLEGKNQIDQEAIVHLSTSLKEAQSINEASSSQSDIREDKVSALKAQVDSGTYRVASKDIADKLVDAFIDEII